MNAVWQSPEQEFKSDIKNLQSCSDKVRDEIRLAKAQADHQDQALQSKEREAASGYRQKLGGILSQTGNKLDTINEWQLQQDKRRSRTFPHSLQFVVVAPDDPPEERRRQLLASLSSHDHLPPFKRAYKERHCNTAEWVFHTAEFRR